MTILPADQCHSNVFYASSIKVFPPLHSYFTSNCFGNSETDIMYYIYFYFSGNMSVEVLMTDKYGRTADAMEYVDVVASSTPITGLQLNVTNQYVNTLEVTVLNASVTSGSPVNFVITCRHSSGSDVVLEPGLLACILLCIFILSYMRGAGQRSSKCICPTQKY